MAIFDSSWPGAQISVFVSPASVVDSAYAIVISEIIIKTAIIIVRGRRQIIIRWMAKKKKKKKKTW